MKKGRPQKNQQQKATLDILTALVRIRAEDQFGIKRCTLIFLAYTLP
jgi:hypothetical protein